MTEIARMEIEVDVPYGSYLTSLHPKIGDFGCEIGANKTFWKEILILDC